MATRTSVAQAVNKAVVIGFSVTTSDATSTNVITAAQIGAEGYGAIRDIHLLCTGDKCFLGLGKTATKTHGKDIVPVFKNGTFDFENCVYDSLNVIRNGSTNVTVEGWVVIG